MSAPERIWANCDTPDARLKSGRWHQSPYGTMYILATPEALAASPEVQALIEEARRDERERAAEFFAAVLCDYQKHMTDAPEVE